MSDANDQADLAVRIVEDPAQADQTVYVVNQQVVAGTPAEGDVPVVQDDGSLAWGAGGGAGGPGPRSRIFVGSTVDNFLANNLTCTNAFQYIDALRNIYDTIDPVGSPVNPLGDALTFEAWSGSADYAGAGQFAAGTKDILIHEAGRYAIECAFGIAGDGVGNAPALATGEFAWAPSWTISSLFARTLGGTIPHFGGSCYFTTPPVFFLVPDEAPLPFPLSWWSAPDVICQGIATAYWRDAAVLVTKISD